MTNDRLKKMRLNQVHARSCDIREPEMLTFSGSVRESKKGPRALGSFLSSGRSSYLSAHALPHCFYVKIQKWRYMCGSSGIEDMFYSQTSVNCHVLT